MSGDNKMTCPHHPEYNPAEGEPTEELDTVHVRNNLPCPWCWQAYAHYQRERADAAENRVRGLRRELFETENDLLKAEADRDKLQARLDGAERRHLCLRCNQIQYSASSRCRACHCGPRWMPVLIVREEE